MCTGYGRAIERRSLEFDLLPFAADFSPCVALLIGVSQHPARYKEPWKKGKCHLKGDGCDSVLLSALGTPGCCGQKWILISQKETVHRF